MEHQEPNAIRKILRNLRGEVHPPEFEEPTLDLNEDLLVKEVARELEKPLPLHTSLFDELALRRQALYRSEAELVEKINSDHRDLASIRMSIDAIEASMHSLKTRPIDAKVEENLHDLRQRKRDSEAVK